VTGSRSQSLGFGWFTEPVEHHRGRRLKVLAVSGNPWLAFFGPPTFPRQLPGWVQDALNPRESGYKLQ
jgi:hypothetical protein